MNTWQLQSAKSHFSEVVKEAINKGPQQITLRGEPVVIILSIKEFEKLAQPQQSFIAFIRQSPLVDLNLNLTRDKTGNRDVNL